MKKRAKRNEQISLFPRDKNMVSLEEYKEMVSNKKPKQHEKKFMNSIIQVANTMDLPAIHIEYFCGNKFYPTCSGSRYVKHAPTRAICPTCHKPVLAVCVNRINKGLSGNFDILGIEWAIETKHKINKGEQDAKLSPRQIVKKNLYDSTNIPNIAINESDNQLAFDFLRAIHNQKFPDKLI